ncbi:CBS domain-containing protein [Hoyosella sp. YIM 151337]|uniref:CBS domain-containing protein n=1 Tax=Hoyosella sp. YIM 151337 TaxID=2992742 RepID=UPI00223683F8|nr:CBS domain-containing protein [Hoyosella sp. YIM 151337]MCW4353702.1 CBS domain-containing protein [Hoyosella sp. YIM 151337]
MRISDLLRNKGSNVATADPKTTVSELIGALAQHNVGAMVVVEEGRVIGIVSERDIVRKLHKNGAAVLNAPVSAIMTTDVVSCVPSDHVNSLAEIMTERRVRHMPVVLEGELIGIVSIGDVVKSRINELEDDREQLESYISGGR